MLFSCILDTFYDNLKATDLVYFIGGPPRQISLQFWKNYKSGLKKNGGGGVQTLHPPTPRGYAFVN
jgi:hypothetical protein